MEDIEMAGYTQTQYCLRSNGWEGLQQFQQPTHNFAGNSFGIITHPKFGRGTGIGTEGQILTGTVFSSEPESELTYNGSASYKRNRDNQMMAAMKTQQQENIHLDVSKNLGSWHNPIRLQDDSPSTSGRLQEITSYLYNQDLEMEAYIKLQNQNLSLVMDEAWKKHCRWVMCLIEQQTQKKLQEKETELEKLQKLNTELEEKIKHMIAESQMWFNLAKNSEATVSAMRLSLERVLFQNTVEGYGETAGDEEESSSKPTGGKVKCKACGDGEVSVIVLPCRHLSVCKDCEKRVDCCPVCYTLKNATLQVSMS